jgi:hypothetical protein
MPTRAQDRDPIISAVASKWRFFKVPADIVKQCRSNQRNSDVCSCGTKAKCYDMPVRAPDSDDNVVDQTYTTELVRHLLGLNGGDGYFEVFKLLNDHIVSYMRRYCQETSRKYGRDLIVAFKGGNVFSVLFLAFIDSLSVQAPGLIDKYSKYIKINDLDFEVFARNEAFKNIFDVMDVAKIAAMSTVRRANVFDGAEMHRVPGTGQVLRRMRCSVWCKK